MIRSVGHLARLRLVLDWSACPQLGPPIGLSAWSAEVHLQRWTRVAGYCAVIWRHGHIAEPPDLSPMDAGGYWNEVLAVGRAVGTLLNPIKLNCLTLGNTLPHLHTHVVPRYQHDPAPAAPLAWNQIVSDGAADETDLQAQAIELLL